MFANASLHRARLLVSRTCQLVSRYRADSSGVAAIEFAFVVPIMFVMFVGAVELSQAVTVDRRVKQAGVPWLISSHAGDEDHPRRRSAIS